MSKVVGKSWLFVPANAVGGMGHIRDCSLPRNAEVQANLEIIHTIIRPVCASFQKISGGFLILRLEYV